jgi:hypothetical protein
VQLLVPLRACFGKSVSTIVSSLFSELRGLDGLLFDMNADTEEESAHGLI